MMKRRLSLILLLVSLTSAAGAVDASEQLHYRLSYSGLLTGFFWKKLADVTFKIQPEVVSFRQQSACRLSMEIDTSAYLFSEMIHPVRYRWESTLSPNLQQTLLSRNIDSGASDLHEAAWYDWENSEISLFRKRKQIDLNRDSWDEEAQPHLVWEEDRYRPAPDFIDPLPPIKGGQNGLKHLLQNKMFKKALSDAAIDPLAMIRRARLHDYDALGPLSMQVALDEELHLYQARLEERESISINRHPKRSTLKVEISRGSEEGQKGSMHLWLADNAQRLPLRIDINAPLGMIHLELVRTEEDSSIKNCPPTQLALHKKNS